MIFVILPLRSILLALIFSFRSDGTDALSQDTARSCVRQAGPHQTIQIRIALLPHANGSSGVDPSNGTVIRDYQHLDSYWQVDFHLYGHLFLYFFDDGFIFFFIPKNFDKKEFRRKVFVKSQEIYFTKLLSTMFYTYSKKYLFVLKLLTLLHY